MIKTYVAAFVGVLIGIAMVNVVGRATAAPPTNEQPSWRLTVNEPQALVDIDTKGSVTIHGDVHSRAFWERVAAAFKEDCPAPSKVGQNLWLTPTSDSALTRGSLFAPVH